MGPGMITGASDDDPSGILTYLQAGVVIGFKILWTALFTLPLMYGIQEMCARISMVSRKGLMRILKEHYPRPLLYFIAFISVAVITINIGADLLAISIVLERFIPLPRTLLLPALAIAILLGVIFFSYRRFAAVLKWLSLSLVFYILAVLYLRIDWLTALRATFTPSFNHMRQGFALFAALIGTTISPYLFFWQASEEIEEEENTMRTRSLRRFIVTKNELRHLRRDTFSGMFFSNLAMWFIIAGAAQIGLLYAVGHIDTFSQAALVLQPLLGGFAFAAFGLGIVGTGLLAIPVLAGSVGYIFAEVFGLEEGMNKTFYQAKGFYAAIVAATILGIFVSLAHANPVTLLIQTAILYAIITPPLIFIIIRIGNNPRIMKQNVNSVFSNTLGWIAFVVTLLSVIAYFATL